MIQYHQLNHDDKEQIQQLAFNYFALHKTHIYSLIKKDTNKIPPCGSDLFHPELWKEIHWKWFLDNQFDIVR